jgi:hypothetical protein
MYPAFTKVNTALGNLISSSHSGAYHSFRPNHSARYPAEFQYRFNRRFKIKEDDSSLHLCRRSHIPLSRLFSRTV